MIPISKIDTVIAFWGLLLFVGALDAILTSFDPTAGGASSVGNLKMQATSGFIYLSTFFLVLCRIEKFLYFSQKNLLILLFLLIPIFSIFWSIAPDVTARRAVALVGTSVFAMYLAFAMSADRILRILAAVYALTAVVSLILAVGLPTYGTHQFGEYVGVWRGLYAQKNEFGATMAMGAIVLFLCPTRSAKERLLVRMAIVLCLFLMVMSESRAAWIAFSCVCLAAFAVKRIGGAGAKTSVKVFILLLFSAIIGGAIIQNATPLLELIGKESTLNGRTDVWSLALDRAADRPLLGYGYRAYWIDGNKDRLQSYEGWSDHINHGHNTYLDLFVELGCLGIFAFALVVISLFFRIIRRVRKSSDYLTLWAVCSISFIIVRGSAESTILQHADINWVLFVYFFCLLYGYGAQLNGRFTALRALGNRIMSPKYVDALYGAGNQLPEETGHEANRMSRP
jgi:O-antigen ligase